jgi:glycosyltransferase involved in cell wall biosynthesis
VSRSASGGPSDADRPDRSSGSGLTVRPLSILLPCRDAAEHLDDAVDSIRAQTFEDFEVIAIDDGSRDGTPGRLEAWAREDGRVRVLAGHGRGLVPALATALSAARGAFVARMDADDIAEPTRLEQQVRRLRHDTGLAACGTGVRYFPRDLVRDGARRYESWINALHTHDQIARDIFIECPIPHPTLMIRRNVLLGVGGYREMGWPEDYDLVLRLWAAGYSLAKLPEVLYRWRESPGRASRTDPRYRPERFRQLKIHVLRRTLLSGGRDAVIWGAGPLGKLFARDLAAAGTTIRAFVDLSPRKIGQDIHGAPVVAMERFADYLGRGPGRRALVLAAVGQEGARAAIREECRRQGLVEGEDFVAVA